MWITLIMNVLNGMRLLLWKLMQTATGSMIRLKAVKAAGPDAAVQLWEQAAELLMKAQRLLLFQNVQLHGMVHRSRLVLQYSSQVKNMHSAAVSRTLMVLIM